MKPSLQFDTGRRNSNDFYLDNSTAVSAAKKLDFVLVRVSTSSSGFKSRPMLQVKLGRDMTCGGLINPARLIFCKCGPP
jgi:hypothetical protein